MTYVILSDTFDNSLNVVEAINSDGFIESITNGLTEQNINVENIDGSWDTSVEVSFKIGLETATTDPHDAADV